MNLSALFLTLAFWHTALVPSDSMQFFVTPDEPAVFTFAEAPGESASEAANQSAPAGEFCISDVNGEEIRCVQGQISADSEQGKRFTVSVTLPQGYFELTHSASGQTFGIVSLPAFCGDEKANLQQLADPFFAIDGAMSWLVRQGNFERKREELARIARRSGIGMIRDRLSWNECQPQEGIENVVLEPKRKYDSCRKAQQKHGVLVLELCHDAPHWMERVGEKYPQNLLAVRDFWNVITPRWNRTWGGMEVWNEPEIFFGANLPADQYVPMLKTIAYQQQNSPDEQKKLAETGERTPMAGGVHCTCNQQWLDHSTECGMLDACDVFSFHTYARAPEMEALYSRYQAWLRKSGQPEKPIWLTECGRPWTIGPGRPPQEEDLVSAIDIVMKGVEAKAFGIQRYFPFVFPYYEERQSNFGMMSRDYSPLRSFAAYAQSARVLSHREYLGDLKIPLENWTHARLFSSSKSASSCESSTGKEACLAVIYAPTVEERELVLPASCPILHAERVTGEVLPVNREKNAVHSNDGFVYLWLDAKAAEPFLNTETPMNQIRKERFAGQMDTRMKKCSPIILRYQIDESQVQWTPLGYQFPQNCEEEITLEIEASNLSGEAKTIPVKCTASAKDAVLKAPEKITVPANGTAKFQVKVISGVEFRKKSTYCRVQIEAEDRIVVPIQTQMTLKQILSTAEKTEKMNLKAFSQWEHGAPKCCEHLSYSKTSENWTLRAHFTEGDRWVYPRFELPENVNLKDFDGFILRARCWDYGKNTEIRFFTYQPECAYFTASGIIPTDGEWHIVQVPFDSLSWCAATGGKALPFLPEQVRKISVGGNTKNESLLLEVSDFYFYKNE